VAYGTSLSVVHRRICRKALTGGNAAHMSCLANRAATTVGDGAMCSGNASHA
jgi:hypothetical protein